MKHINKFFQTIMVMALAVCLTSMPVMAKESIDYDAVQQENEAVAYASVPAGFTHIATFSRTPQTYYFATVSVQKTSSLQLYLPNNGRQDWIQGEVTFTPVGSGAEEVFKFTNMSGENKTFSLSGLTPGVYEIRMYAYAFGTSNQAKAYYKYNP